VGKSNALDVSFVREPIGLDLDWQLVAKISPCYVTVHLNFCIQILLIVDPPFVYPLPCGRLVRL
jgi:hypothetical protein